MLLNGDGNDNPPRPSPWVPSPSAAPRVPSPTMSWWTSGASLRPYEMNTLLVSGDMMRQMLKLEEFQNP